MSGYTHSRARATRSITNDSDDEATPIGHSREQTAASMDNDRDGSDEEYSLIEEATERDRRHRQAPEWYRHSMLGICEFGNLSPPPLPEDHVLQINSNRFPGNQGVDSVQGLERSETAVQYVENEEAAHAVPASLDRCYNLLNTHLQRQNQFLIVFDLALHNFEASSPSTYTAFRRHVRHAQQAAQSVIRQLIIITWFEIGLPDDVKSVLQQIIDGRVRQLNLEEHIAELENDHDRLVGEEYFHARRADLPLWGWDMNDDDHPFNEFCAIECDDIEELAPRLEAAFEVRKTRVMYACEEDRFPWASDESISLDCMMIEWTHSVCQKLQHIIDWDYTSTNHSAEEHAAAHRANTIIQRAMDFWKELRARHDELSNFNSRMDEIPEECTAALEDESFEIPEEWAELIDEEMAEVLAIQGRTRGFPYRPDGIVEFDDPDESDGEIDQDTGVRD